MWKVHAGGGWVGSNWENDIRSLQVWTCLGRERYRRKLGETNIFEGGCLVAWQAGVTLIRKALLFIVWRGA